MGGLYVKGAKRSWAGVFGLLRSPEIDSKGPIPPGCVAWWAGMKTLFLFPTRFLAPIDCLKIPALFAPLGYFHSCGTDRTAAKIVVLLWKKSILSTESNRWRSLRWVVVVVGKMWKCGINLWICNGAKNCSRLYGYNFGKLSILYCSAEGIPHVQYLYM